MQDAQKRFQQAIDLFDQLNSQDPNQVIFQEKAVPKELLYAQRMTERLETFAPDASEALQLAARCQHICRWEIPRSDYPLGRKGYHQWRNELKKFHANKAAEVLNKVGYDQALIDRVKFLVSKQQLKKDADTQVLEDVICLVFLDYYFIPFAAKHPREKVIDIVGKTWRKMSEAGQQAALALDLDEDVKVLISEAL